MNTIILTKGLPASGKTTFAKSVVKETNGQTVRVDLNDLREMTNQNNWSKKSEHLTQRIRDHIILENLLSGHDVIVDDTNLNPMVEYEIRKRFSKIANIKIKDFTHIPLETCIDRNSAREQKVPTDLIIDLHEKYINGKH
jgi:tRNA uridine 5-carbamoylmethylation protein Kti12